MSRFTRAELEEQLADCRETEGAIMDILDDEDLDVTEKVQELDAVLEDHEDA